MISSGRKRKLPSCGAFVASVRLKERMWRPWPLIFSRVQWFKSRHVGRRLGSAVVSELFHQCFDMQHLADLHSYRFIRGISYSTHKTYIMIIHIYAYIYIYTYICVHIHTHIYIYTHSSLNIYLCVMKLCLNLGRRSWTAMCFTSFMARKNQCMKHLQAIKLSQFGVFETAVYIEWASARVPPTPLKRRGGAAGAGWIPPNASKLTRSWDSKEWQMDSPFLFLWVVVHGCSQSM